MPKISFTFFSSKEGRPNPCNNCSTCEGFPGYGPPCKYWTYTHV